MAQFAPIFRLPTGGAKMAPEIGAPSHRLGAEFGGGVWRGGDCVSGNIKLVEIT